MHLPRSFSLLLSLPLISLIAFSGASIDAHAVYSGGRYMTASEARQVFGDIISCTYFNGSDYVSGSFSYDSYGTWSPNSLSSSDGSYTYEGDVWLQYTANLSGLNQNPNYITVDLAPLYSIFDTTQIHTCIALSSNSSISTVYQSPAWDWVYSGTNYHIENTDTDTSGNYHAHFSHASLDFTYVCVDLTSQSLSSGYSSRAVFYGNGGVSPMRLYIGVPYVDSAATGETGTFTTASGGSGGGTNININIDMSETNEELQQQTGILSTISSWLSSFFTTLGNTVLSWFMPSQNFLSNWVARIKGILYDHLSPWGDMDDTISNVLDRIVAALGEGGVESVEFPALSVPGTDFSTQSISVPLWPSGSSSLQYWVKLAVNLVSTIWVCNMILNKIKSKILGESVVEVEELENNDN